MLKRFEKLTIGDKFTIMKPQKMQGCLLVKNSNREAEVIEGTPQTKEGVVVTISDASDVNQIFFWPNKKNPNNGGKDSE